MWHAVCYEEGRSDGRMGRQCRITEILGNLRTGEVMKLINVKTLLSVGILSIVGLVGMSTEVSAQGNSGWAHEKNRIKKQQKQELKEARAELQQLKQQVRQLQSAAHHHPAGSFFAE